MFMDLKDFTGTTGKTEGLCWLWSRSGYPNTLYLTIRNSKHVSGETQKWAKPLWCFCLLLFQFQLFWGQIFCELFVSSTQFKILKDSRTFSSLYLNFPYFAMKVKEPHFSCFPQNLFPTGFVWCFFSRRSNNQVWLFFSNFAVIS